MTENRFTIQSFIHELSAIPMSDLLVTVPVVSAKLIELTNFDFSKVELSLTTEVRAIVKTAQAFRKEADVQSLCIAYRTVEWSLKGQPIATPLFLIPVDWKIQKASNELMCLPFMDRVEINPYVKRLLQQWTDVTLPEWTELDFTQLQVEVEQWFKAQNFPAQLSGRAVLGNFHYHRYHLLRELEGIAQSEQSSVLIDELMGQVNAVQPVIPLPTAVLSPADIDQQAVFAAYERGNVVIQGPPGTGKSQVLTNLIGKLVAIDKRVLVVSEKKTALEVIQKKLQEAGLGYCTQVVHSQTSNTAFNQQLKKAWLFLESYSGKHSKSLQLTEQRIAQLQLLLDRLNAPDTIGGVSMSVFRELETETPPNSPVFSTDVPGIDEWLIWKKSVVELGKSVPDFQVLSQFKPAFFSTINGDVLLAQLQRDWEVVSNWFELGTAEELKFVYQSLGRCQLILNESFKNYYPLIQRPREWKRFEKNIQQLERCTKAFELASREKATWKFIPSESQLTSWGNATSFWEKRRRNRAIRKMLHDPSVDPEVALASWLNFTRCEREKMELEHYFRLLDLEPDLTHLAIGVQFAKRLQDEDGGVLQQIAQWPRSKTQAYISHQHEITRVVHQLATYFEVTPEVSISNFLLEKMAVFQQLLPSWQLIQQLPSSFFRITRNGTNWKELQAFIVYSNWKMMEARYPELAKLTGETLGNQLDTILREADEEMSQFANQLMEQQVARFRDAEALLRKPLQKCTAPEKIRRLALKNGKAILVKEFAKQKAHKSIRELLASDAREWIQLIVPIWLATPAQVADHFPLVQGIFDTVIFDEASQLILPNALGALYRSNRAVVAGDEHQMSPRTFFGKQWAGHDLLHQANFYYQRTALKHHYRSTSPELISFSNQHFYNNELVVYPQPQVEQVVFRHFCPDAQFIHRRNDVEASAIASFLTTVDWEETIGIVAFSEEQLQAIWEKCSPAIQQKISDGQESNRVLFKALEQVQGDEVDWLIVSMGYAPNAEEQFQLRFGPLNQADGYKRLNVLLTRAVKKIHFFTSVHAADFGVSSNESINLVRKYLVQLEQPSQQTIAMQFPYFIQPEVIAPNICHLPQVYAHLKQAEEFITFHRVMKKRGWEISYQL